MKPYKLYRDRDQIFECQLHLDGSSVEKANARIILEVNDSNLMFNGNVDKSGNCRIPISKLNSNFHKNITSGLIRLEVIAEGLIFNIWKSGFIVENSEDNVDINLIDLIEQKEYSDDWTDVLNNIQDGMIDLMDYQSKAKGRQKRLEETVNNQVKNIHKTISSINENIEVMSDKIHDDRSPKDKLNELYKTNKLLVDPLSQIRQNLKEDKEYTDIVSKWGSTDPLSQIRPDPEEDKEYTNIVSKWSANADK